MRAVTFFEQNARPIFAKRFINVLAHLRQIDERNILFFRDLTDGFGIIAMRIRDLAVQRQTCGGASV